MRDRRELMLSTGLSVGPRPVDGLDGTWIGGGMTFWWLLTGVRNI